MLEYINPEEDALPENEVIKLEKPKKPKKKNVYTSDNAFGKATGVNILGLNEVDNQPAPMPFHKEYPNISKPKPVAKKQPESPFGRVVVPDVFKTDKFNLVETDKTAADKLKTLRGYSVKVQKDVQELRSATALDLYDEDSINVQIEEESKPRTITTNAGGSGFSGSTQYTTSYKTVPFGKEIQQVKIQNIGINLTNDQILEKAKQLKRVELASTIKEKKTRDFLNSTSWWGKSEKQQGIESYLGAEKSYLQTKKTESIMPIGGALIADYAEDSKKYKELYNRINKTKQSDIKTQEQYDIYKSDADQAKNLYSSLEVTRAAINKTNEDYVFANRRLDSVDKEYDNAKRHYGLDNIPLKAIDTFSNFADDITLVSVLGLDLLSHLPANINKAVTGDVTEKKWLGEATSALGVAYAEKRAKQEAYYEKDTIDSGLGLVKHAGNLLITQLPNIAMGLLSMGAEPAAMETAMLLTEEAVSKGLLVNVATTTAEKSALSEIISLGANDALEAASIKIVNGQAISGVERGLLKDAVSTATNKAQKNALTRLVQKATQAEATALPDAILKQGLKNAAASAAATAGESNVVNALKWTLDKAKISEPVEMGMLASSMGSKVSELEYSNSLPASEGGTNYSAGDILLSSALWGWAETVGEKVQIKATGAWAKTIMAATEEAPDLVRSIAKEQFKNVFLKTGGILRHQFDENVSEQFTNVTQNVIDKHLLGKDVGYFDNAGTVLKDTALLAGLMTTAPHIAGMAIKPFFVTNEQKQIVSITNKLSPLIAELKKPLSKEQAKVVNDQIKQLTAVGSELHKKAIQRIGDMSTNSWKSIIDNSKKLAGLRAEAKSVYNSDIDNKKVLLSGLQDKYDVISRNTAETLAKTSDLNDIGLFKNMAIQDRRTIVENLTEIERLEQLGKGNKSTAGLHVEKIKTLREANSELLLNKSNENLDKIVASISEKYGGLGETTTKVIEANAEFVKLKEKEYAEKSKGISPEAKVALKNRIAKELKESNVKEVGKEFRRLKREQLIKDLEGKSEDIQKTLKNNFKNELVQFRLDTKDSNVNAFAVTMPRLDSSGNQLKDKNGRLLSDNVIITNKRTTMGSAGTLGSKGLDVGTKASHELLHILFAKAFGIDQNAFVPMANALLDYIAKENPEIANGIQKYIETAYSKAEAGIQAEEAIVLISELISSGQLKYNESFFKKVGIMLNNIFNNVFRIPELIEAQGVDLSTGKDVYDFLGSYSQSFSTGKLSPEFQKALEGGVSGNIFSEFALASASETIQFSKSIEDRIDALYEAYADDQMDQKEFEKRLAVLEDEELNGPNEEAVKQVTKKEKIVNKEEEEVKEIINNAKGAVASDKVQKLYEAKGINAANDIIKLFKPITAKIVNKRRDAPGFDEELLTDEIETGEGGILYLIKDYNPVQGIPLAAYINKYLPLRAITASRRVLDTQFNKDAAEEVGLVATETADQNMTERVAEKPKYKDALESKVLAPEVLASVIDKTIKVVRLLKNRIDAPITLNRTVTPLIAEIRDEVGKQLDIDIKTALGGKKGGALVKELLRTKRYILENMTTTWLMGKDGQGGIPQAIQKRVDGKWLNFPAWVNQKIDRESVSTDLAGRTSGSELVRRLPNVFNNVSDEEFLSQIVGPDGNPLRGRKESLSKAMAEEIAFDVINNDLANEGPIFDALSANQQRLGVELNNALDVEFRRQADRGNVKFSKSSDMGDYLYLLELGGWSRKFAPFKLFEKGLSVKQKVELNKVFAKLNKKGLIAKYQEWWESNEGVKYEKEKYKQIYDLKNKLVGNELKFTLDSKAPDRYNSKKPDLVIVDNTDEKNKLNTIVELKAGLDAFLGSTSNNKWFSSDKFAREFTGSVNVVANLKNNYARQNFIDGVKEKINAKDSNFRIQNGVVQVLGSYYDNNNLDRPKPVETILGMQSLSDLNLGKDVLQIKGVGAFAFPNTYIAKSGAIEELKGNVIFSSEFRTGRVGKDSKWRSIIERSYIKFPEDFNQETNTDLDTNPIGFFKSIELANIQKVATINNNKLVAINNLNKNSITPKGISVFDFDDTTGITTGSVLYTMPNGTSGKLNAEEFAKNGSVLLDGGAIFDFSEFSKVVNGKPGPMVEKMKKMIGKFGPENFFILTARPADAAAPIHEFLSSIGINIPLENITGLGSSSAQSKADWMVNKAAEGYNDFYFSDDAIQNVTAVKNALAVLDVKSKIQQARIKFSKTISSEFNKILELNKGVAVSETFSDIVAKRKGAGIGKYRFFVPPSAADFELLLYDFIGKGATGEEQYKFFTQALLEPYANGMALMDSAKQSIKNDYNALIKAFPGVKKELGKLTPDKDFTYDQALRVSMWAAMGVEIPGLQQSDITKLNGFVNSDPELSAFKAGLIATGRQGSGWIEPSEYWDSETIISDLHNITEKVGRKNYLGEFIENSQEMFSPENLNKIETIYGSNFREALVDILYRMTNGTNRDSGPSRINNQWLNWINNSTAAIMFLNTRSAILQTIGSINYLNWRDNNPINAAKAFANQPQYWKDFAMIFNSDKIKERRAGLKEDVSSAEIANQAQGSKNKVGAVISYLLKKGFGPTQVADSFAIASGGAAFYRNRVDYNVKQGMSQQEAEDQAWKDFSKITDETQQSGDPRDISQQQASVAGRLVLAFQNTAMQQSRLVKKSGLDLINRRGDAKTHIAKIVYYTAVQNIIFGALQSALFTIGFGDDEEDDKKKVEDRNDKMLNILNGISDTILRGSGMGGAIVATLKNVALKYMEQNDKGFKADYAKVIVEATNIAPPIGSKLTKFYGAIKTSEFEKDVIAKRGWSVSMNGKLNLSPSYSVAAQGIEASTNLPVNRAVMKINNLAEALDSRNKSWQRIAMLLGYSPYVIGAKNEESELIKKEAKVVRKEAGVIKSAETRAINKEKLRNRIDKMSDAEYEIYADSLAAEKERRIEKKAKLLGEY